MTFKQKATFWLQITYNKLTNYQLTEPLYKGKLVWLLLMVSVILVVALCGCTTPVQVIRPQAPAALMTPPATLTLLPSSPSASKTTKNTID